jgi:predicted phage-related endonuclease
MATVLKFAPVVNPIEELKKVKEEMSLLKTKEEGLKAALFFMMDEQKSDKLILGDFSAERKLVVQPRLDTKKAKEMLGDNAPMTEVESVRLTLC